MPALFRGVLFASVCLYGAVALAEQNVASPATSSALPSSVVAQTATTVTDIIGRTVTVNVPVQRVILGEGRMLYLVAMLDRENPAQHLVAWRQDLISSDPAGWQQYRTRFPALAQLPTFGGNEQDTFSLEQAINLKPDVIMMNIDARANLLDAGYEAALQKVGIPIVYVDFRYNPTKNTEPTVRLFGELFGQQQRASAFIHFRNQELKRVADRVADMTYRPKVFIERIGGYSETCCLTFGDGNFGRFVSLAGGDNIAAHLSQSVFFTANPEHIIAANPDIIIITSGNFQAFVPGGHWIALGAGADIAAAQQKLAWFTSRAAYASSNARHQGAFYAIWHQFYNSPYDFIAIQQLAKWIHPERFTTLDPSDTFRRLHQQFLAVPYLPGYMVSLQPETSAERQTAQ